MKITQALWGTMFLLINLPPMAHPADDSEPVGQPIGTLSQGTAPRDGAAGLFTPNSPGNAAAYHAQMNGGLTASPIVDGNGANVHIMVPTATPPTALNSQTGTPGSGMVNTAGRVKSYELVGPAFSNVMAPSPVARQTPVSGSFATRMTPLNGPSAIRRISTPIVRTTQPLSIGKIVVPSRRDELTTQSANPIDSIGQLTGTITYADGQKILLGTAGNATIDPRMGTLTLPNGAKLSMKSAEKLVRRVEQKNQVRM